MSKTKGNAPIVVIASIAIIVFSAVGIGVMLGFIPSSYSRSGDSAAQVAPAKTAPAGGGATAPHKVQTAGRTFSEPARVAMACTNCGTVQSVNVVEHKGEGSGLGAAGGAVVGGLLGNQIGRGDGRTVATVVGAGAGALAGNEVEKRVKTSKRFDVAVRMEDGTLRSFPYEGEPGFRTGDRVRVVDGRLVAN